MRQAKVLICRFPGLLPGGAEHPDTTDWLVPTVIKIKSDKRISSVHNWRISDTPITMGRNRAVKMARSIGADLLVFLDADMAPDLYLGRDPKAVPFWDTAFNFWFKHYDQGPCIIGAPYGGPPPVENVYIFRWARQQDDHPNPDFRLEQYTRDEAADLHGFQEVAALPTGLMLIDFRTFERLDPPYFYYEWKDEEQSEKASTEDVTFTRDASLAGVPNYCLWDAWAGHHKWKCVGRPTRLYPKEISSKFRAVVERQLREEAAPRFNPDREGRGADRLEEAAGEVLLSEEQSVQHAFAVSAPDELPGSVPAGRPRIWTTTGATFPASTTGPY